MAASKNPPFVEAIDDVVAPPDPAPLAKQTLAYGLSGLIVPIVGMITLPIFARAFTQSQYGILELGTVTLTVALAITDAGLTAAALRGFYDYRSDEDHERRRVMLTGFVASTVVALALAGAMVVFRAEISRWLFQRSDEETLVIIIAASIPAVNTWRYVSEVMRIKLQAFDYLVTTLIAAGLTTLLGVIGVVVLDWRVNGVFFAGLVGNAVAATYGLLVVRRALIGRFSRLQLGRMLSYGLPLVPSALAGWALALVDRVILARLGNLSQVGEYAIANRLASLLLIGMTAFLFALSPFLLATYSKDAAQERAARGRTLTYLTFILSFAGLTLTLFAKEAINVLAPKFVDAHLAVGPLALGAAAYGIATLLTNGLAIARKTVYLGIFGVACSFINIGLNFALIPPFGIVGAAFATTLGYGALAGSYYWASQRVYPTSYEPRKVLTMLGLASILGVLGSLPLGPLPVALSVKLAALATFVAVTRVAGAMTGAEFGELRRFVTGMIPFRRPAASVG
jgi:O-antigen/teichoic acid export membrane protein